MLTTPGVACLVRQNDFQAGVVISASHNPYHDNGVKLFSHAGMKFPDAEEERLEDGNPALRGEPVPATRPALTANHALHVEYLDFLRSRVIPGAKLSGMRAGAGLREWRGVPVGTGIVSQRWARTWWRWE